MMRRSMWMCDWCMWYGKRPKDKKCPVCERKVRWDAHPPLTRYWEPVPHPTADSGKGDDDP